MRNFKTWVFGLVWFQAGSGLFIEDGYFNIVNVSGKGILGADGSSQEHRFAFLIPSQTARRAAADAEPELVEPQGSAF